MSINPFTYAMAQVNVPAGRALWIYGEAGVAALEVYQPWKAPAQQLQHSGCNVYTELDSLKPDFDAVFVNCPKQHEETEGLIAKALELSKTFVMIAAPNAAGGTRLKKILEAYGIEVEQASKSHFRIVWTLKANQADKSLIQKNKAALALRNIQIENENWWTIPGLFGWDKVDIGSKLLLEHLPKDISGHVADFGCGYGYLSAMAVKRYPAIISIDAYDADARAIECCKRNCKEKVNPLWENVPSMHIRKRYDAIIMNPPFHTGKGEDIGLGKAFITKAWDSLRSGGKLYMVANRTLPYEKTVPGLKLLYENADYKILSGVVP